MRRQQAFITNDENQSLQERLNELFNNTAHFDCLVGYFYLSGFHAMYPALEDTEKIRILIGMSTDRQTQRALDGSYEASQESLGFSQPEAKKSAETCLQKELEDSEDSKDVEEGIRKFIEWIRNDKLEIRVYRSRNLHAKLYIMTFQKGDRDIGRVITGSSNFSKSGLKDNLEFNVELSNPNDYEFAKDKFEELWRDSVKLNHEYLTIIPNQTWLNENIRPYELYLKFLYEYFQDELTPIKEDELTYVPEKFKQLEYQQQAVSNAKKILGEYGGVFISDVVGLGKTYIAAMLTKRLDGRTLIIAPPMLLDRNNPSSWNTVFSDFKIAADTQSLGKLEDLTVERMKKYKNVIIDEAHRFRTETTKTYEQLMAICRGKRVILVTATPYNNSPNDILSLLKLFQKTRKSNIPNLPNLESFFDSLNKKLKNLDRKKDYNEYMKIVKSNGKEIRMKVLKYLMVRRTRTEIEKYFAKDMKNQGVKFPNVKKPEPLYYKLSQKEDGIFDHTIEIISQKIQYARYTPMLYYTGKLQEFEKQSQRNMGRFMKVLLIKRLESSFFAFKKSIDRFVKSYEMFLEEFKKGNVYISKNYSHKVFELLESDDDEKVQSLIDDKKVSRYKSKDFTEELEKDIRNDTKHLKEIQKQWSQVNRDPKLLKFIKELSKNPILKKNHLIIFTESKETAAYLHEEINLKYPQKVLLFTGSSDKSIRDKVLENFDANSDRSKNNYRILVSTEVLSEGVNLHRSNVVINYDIPWNPTRMMQRVGRINRIDTPFDEIHTFNFFPTTQSNDEIRLEEAAKGKINAFLSLLGGDSALLTEGEPIASHELFERLLSTKPIEGEESEESELKYLEVIREIRENDPSLFEKIKKLPRKARTAKHSPTDTAGLLSYIRQGRIQKFYMTQKNRGTEEKNFMEAAGLLESKIKEEKKKLPTDFYTYLEKNKKEFIYATSEEEPELESKSGHNVNIRLLKTLRAAKQRTGNLTDSEEEYLLKVIQQIEEGAFPKKTIQELRKRLDALREGMLDSSKIVGVLQKYISPQLLEEHRVDKLSSDSRKREVILSMYMTEK